MTEEKPNPETGQTPKDGATELPEYSKEQIAGMTKEQLADLYANSREAIKTATQRNQEAAQIKKQYGEELQTLKEQKEYYEAKYGELIDKQNELLDKLAAGPPKREGQVTEETTGIMQDPEKFAKTLTAKIAELEKKITQYDEQIALIPGKIEFEKVVDKLISAHKYVDREKLAGYFNVKGEKYPINDETLAQACKDIDVAEAARLDALIEQRKKEQEALEKQATSQVTGTPAAGSPELEGFHDKDDFEQRRILAEMLKKGKI